VYAVTSTEGWEVDASKTWALELSLNSPTPIFLQRIFDKMPRSEGLHNYTSNTKTPRQLKYNIRLHNRFLFHQIWKFPIFLVIIFSQINFKYLYTQFGILKSKCKVKLSLRICFICWLYRNHLREHGNIMHSYDLSFSNSIFSHGETLR
jgi:hypothetical protein